MDFFKTLWNNITDVTEDPVTLGTNAVTTLNIIVWSLFIGFIIAIAATLYNKFVIGKAARVLILKGAHTEDTGLTLAQIGCDNPLIRFALRTGSSLRQIVHMQGDTPEKRQKAEFTSAKFFIPEERIHRAEVMYGKSDITVGTVILSLLAFTAAAFMAFTIIPDLIQLVANFIDGIMPKDNIL